MTTDPLPAGHPDRWLTGEAPTGSILLELGGMAEIAREFDVPRSTASMWAYRRDTSGFPEPLTVLDSGAVYNMATVRSWYATRRTRKKESTDA